MLQQARGCLAWQVWDRKPWFVIDQTSQSYHAKQHPRHSMGFWIRLEEIYPYGVETLPGLSSLDTWVAGVFLDSPIVELGQLFSWAFSSESWTMVILALTIIVFLHINTTRSPFRLSPKWGLFVSFSSPFRPFFFPAFFFFQGIFRANFSRIGVCWN